MLKEFQQASSIFLEPHRNGNSQVQSTPRVNRFKLNTDASVSSMKGTGLSYIIRNSEVQVMIARCKHLDAHLDLIVIEGLAMVFAF